MQETWVWSLDWENPLEKEMAVHSSTLAWKIPWTTEPGRLPSMGSQRGRQDWATSLSLYAEVGSFYAHFWKCFNHKWMLNLVKGFSPSIEIIIWFLSFNLLIWCITLIGLRILKNPCIPGIIQLDHGVWAFWCVAEFCLLKFCRGFLHLCSSVILACSFVFLCCLCLLLVSGWWWPCRMNLEVFLPLQFYERVLEG